MFTGTEPERDLIESIQAEMGVTSHSLVGALDLSAFAAVLARASLLVSNNTGAVHVAAAVGTPVVDLYALTNPQHTPWQVPHRVLFQDVPCKYCYKSVCPEGHHGCLRLVEPARVLNAAAEFSAGPPHQRSREECRLYTLGINAAFHDPAACLVKDGRVLAAAEEERFTHIKHGKRPVPFTAYELPFHAIDFVSAPAAFDC